MKELTEFKRRLHLANCCRWKFSNYLIDDVGMPTECTLTNESNPYLPLKVRFTREKFYRFPKMKGVNDWSVEDQLEKIKEEVKEAIQASDNYNSCLLTTNFESSESKKALEEFLMELFDIIHSVETLLRIEGIPDEDCEVIRELVINKNRERNYYDDIPTHA